MTDHHCCWNFLKMYFSGRNAVTAGLKELYVEQRGAQLLFSRLSEVARLTSRDMDVLTLTLTQINKTDALIDYYMSNKERPF